MDGLSKFGMIFDLFNLPSQVNSNNTRMTRGLTWIKAQFMDKKAQLSTIVETYMKAFAVSRVMDINCVISTLVLPANSIQAFQYPLKGVELIL